jgi:hypothetical protein
MNKQEQLAAKLAPFKHSAVRLLDAIVVRSGKNGVSVVRGKSLQTFVRVRSTKTLHQYIETNVMHFLFSLLRIKGLYMFRALLAHPQEALYKQNLIYYVHVMSVGCTRFKLPL